MRCPECGGTTQVVDSRRSENVVRRSQVYDALAKAHRLLGGMLRGDCGTERDGARASIVARRRVCTVCRAAIDTVELPLALLERQLSRR